MSGTDETPKAQADPRRRSRLGGGILFVFCLVYGYLSGDIPSLEVDAGQLMNAATMPKFLSVLGMLLALLLVVLPRAPGEDRSPAPLRNLHWGRLAAVVVLMLAYGLSIRRLGFVPSTVIFLAAGFVLLGERRPLRVAAVAVSVPVLFWMLMAWGLGVYLPPWPGTAGGGL